MGAARCVVGRDSSQPSQEELISRRLGVSLLSNSQHDACLKVIRRMGNMSVQTHAEKQAKIFARYTLGQDELAARKR